MLRLIVLLALTCLSAALSFQFIDSGRGMLSPVDQRAEQCALIFTSITIVITALALWRTRYAMLAGYGLAGIGAAVSLAIAGQFCRLTPPIAMFILLAVCGFAMGCFWKADR